MLAVPPQGVAQYVGGVAVVQPWGVANDDVYLGVREGEGAHHVADVVGPDVVASIVVEALQGFGGLSHYRLVFFMDGIVGEREGWIVAALDIVCDVYHQPVEGFCVVHERAWKPELEILVAILVVLYLNSDYVPCEQVVVVIAQLQGVAEVDGWTEAVWGCAFSYDGHGGEYPGGAREVDCDGVDVDACDGGAQSDEDIVGFIPCCPGAFDVAAHRFDDERSAPTRRV